MNKSVLAVDDNEAHRYALGRSLEHAGMKVSLARNCEEALKLAEDIPDIILMDVNLPDGLGFEVCAKIRSGTATKRIPVIFMSATAQTQDAIEKGRHAGGDAYLFYPVEMEQLVAVMTGVIAKRAA